METLLACCIGFLTACGVFLMLRGRTFPVVVGLTMLSYAVNLFLFASGRLNLRGAAVLGMSCPQLRMIFLPVQAQMTICPFSFTNTRNFG
mgnify:CR=1 FL=1